MDQIFALKIIVEKYLEKDGMVFPAFMDLEKAITLSSHLCHMHQRQEHESNTTIMNTGSGNELHKKHM